MKILWVNPSFLDYRVPVYKSLFDRTEGNFFLIYSQKRVPERVISKIEKAIGHCAVGLADEKTLNIAGKEEFANSEIRLPYQPGLYKAISKVEADVIIAEGFFQWTPWALLSARFQGKKLIIAYERTAHTERNCPKWRTLYRKIIIKFVNGFSINGQLTKEYLFQLGVSEEKIYIGGMSADSKNIAKKAISFAPQEKDKMKSQLDINNGLTFLYVGQINKPKGVSCLLNAWKKHAAKHTCDSLLIVGSGVMLEKYRTDFLTHSSVKFLGSVDYDLIYRYYAVADIFVMPTLEDNWSLVVPEAMACGLPIACSIYNGCYPELVHEDVNGKLFDPLEETTITTALNYFHCSDLISLGMESIRIEKKYSAETVAQNIYDSCKAILAKKA